MTDSEKIIKYERIITRMNDALTNDLVAEVHSIYSHTGQDIDGIVRDSQFRTKFISAALKLKDAAKEIKSEK